MSTILRVLKNAQTHLPATADTPGVQSPAHQDLPATGPDGYMRMNVRVQIETGDGAVICAHYFGPAEANDKLKQAVLSCDATEFRDHSIRSHWMLETGDPRYLWVNQSVFAGQSRWSCVWISSSTHNGAIGQGWHHSYDMALRFIARPGITPPTLGDPALNTVEHMMLHTGGYRFWLLDYDGILYEFGKAQADGLHLLVRVADANDNADAAFLMKEFAPTQRRACELAHVPRSTFRYEADAEKDNQLQNKLTELAQEQPRYGYRRLEVLLRREGEFVNHKRVFRIYQAAGLSVKRKKRKRLVRSGRPLVTAKTSAPD